MNAVRIPRKNETTQQRLRRLLREKKGTPHHEDYEDGNPSKEMRVRSERTISKDESINEITLEMTGRAAVAHIKAKYGQDWTFKVVRNIDDDSWTLEMAKVE
jgi:hypothetical protein